MNWVRGSLGNALLVALSACEPWGPPSPRLERASLTLLHTADLHSHVFPHPFFVTGRDAARGWGEAGEVVLAGGLARLGALVERERARSERVLYVDGGDLFQGGRAYELFHGEAELVGMAALGLDAMVLGNHDLDDGAQAFAEVIERFGTFPVLATNYLANGERSAVLPWVILDAGGLRVALLGVANVESERALERGSDDLGWWPREEIEAVQEALDVVAASSDVVVALSHLGLDDDRRLVRETVGLDAVLGAHQHLTLDTPEFEHDRVGREVPIVHVGAYGRYLGVLSLSLARGANPALGLERVDHEFALLPAGPWVAESERVALSLEPFRYALERDERPVAFVEAPLLRSAPSGGDSALQNLVADAAWLTTPSDLALITGSSLRADWLPGKLTLGSLYESLPFTDPLVLLTLKGRALRELFEAFERRAQRYGCETPVMVAGAALRFRCRGGATRRGLFVIETERRCASDGQCGEGICAPNSNGEQRCFLEAPEEALLSLVTTRFLLDDYGLGEEEEILGETLREAVLRELERGAPGCPGALPCVRVPVTGRVVLEGAR